MSPKVITKDAVVIGGGISGVASAYRLKRAGLKVLLLEKSGRVGGAVQTERAGGFEPLRYMPKGKIAVLGLVSSKEPQLEKQETLLRRIEEAAKFCPIEQLALSPQCGFQGAADRDGAHMTIDEQRRKLELVVETARKVWV